MGDVIKSQKTQVYWASGPTAATLLVCPTSVSGLGGAKDQVDTTCLSDDERTFVGGLGNPGQVTIPFNVHADELSHEAVMALYESGEVVSWGVYGPQAATAPTAIDSEMQEVAARTSAIFNAYVADVNLDIAGNDIWKGTITLQRSGPVLWKLATV